MCINATDRATYQKSSSNQSLNKPTAHIALPHEDCTILKSQVQRLVTYDSFIIRLFARSALRSKGAQQIPNLIYVCVLHIAPMTEGLVQPSTHK